MVNKYTMPEHKNEHQAKTIINRFKQKSISLPRITDDKRMRGYPGLAGTARKIAKYVPKNIDWYIEPFAGTAKVYQELQFKPNFVLLNDKSKFVFDWLKRDFHNINIWDLDFKQCIYKFLDNQKAFFLIDQPWHKELYFQNFSCFDRKDVKTYDEEILELCRHMKGRFIIASDRKNKRMLESGFNNKLIEGDYMVAGGLTKTLITSNMELE